MTVPLLGVGRWSHRTLRGLEFSGPRAVLIVDGLLPAVRGALMFNPSDSERLALASLSSSHVSSVAQLCPGQLCRSPLGLCRVPSGPWLVACKRFLALSLLKE